MRSFAPSLSLLLLACGSAPSADAGPPAADAPTPPPPSVMLPEGEVRGIRGDGVVNYLGIPYAEAPVGELRFAPPVARAGWDEPVGPIRTPVTCPQTALGIAGGEEDCLIVNVHVPDPAPVDAPVIVWIHGGAFLVNSGVGLDRSTLGDLLARDQGVIVVSMNYRLGPFGFFRQDGVAEGNQGILDQQLALRWVRDHVALFGGDPERVTLMGESAGGVSVCLHLLAPESRGLFHRAVTQSGLCDAELATLDEAEAGLSLLNRRVHAQWERSELLRRVLQAQWHLVRAVDALYVVGSIQPDGTVHGGTGWAVDLARHRGIPVYVFDQDAEAWRRTAAEGWAPAQPRITAQVFGGTGTRFLMPAGRAAIEALFRESFGPPLAG